MKTRLFFKKAMLWGLSISMLAAAGYTIAATNTQTTDTTTSATLKTPPDKQEGTPPAKPDGTPPEGTPPEKPNGTDAPPGEAPGGTQAKVTGTSAFTVGSKTVTKTGVSFKAAQKNQNAIKVTTGGNLTLTKATVSKTGDSTSEESSNFYGLNAGILAEAGGKMKVTNTKITTNSEGSNAIFATGSGTAITVSDTAIVTTKNSSRGLDATYNGTITAKNVNIQTLGAHCAAIATDRGEGTITVTGGTMKTAGEGSPGIYSTGNITVSNAKLTAAGSEAAVIEGKNSIILNNTTLSGAKRAGVMLYQSFSGDAGVGTSVFKMNSGSLTAAVGPLFYITNTHSVVELSDAKLTSASGTLISAAADRWGTTGKNGGSVSFTANKEILIGDILCDAISQVAVSLKNSTELTGKIDSQHQGGKVIIALDKTSKWHVTGTCYLTSIQDEDTTIANIDDNGNTIYYDKTASENSWLDGKTIKLVDGGKLTPSN